MALQEEILDLLVCPLCRGELTPVDQQSGLCCAACRLVFPVRDDIPIMLKEEAVPQDDWDHGLRKAPSGGEAPQP